MAPSLNASVACSRQLAHAATGNVGLAAALQLAHWAVLQDPSSIPALQIKCEVLTACANAETSLMGKSIYRYAAHSCMEERERTGGSSLRMQELFTRGRGSLECSRQAGPLVGRDHREPHRAKSSCSCPHCARSAALHKSHVAALCK